MNVFILPLLICFFSACASQDANHQFEKVNPNLVSSSNFVHYNANPPKLYIEFGNRKQKTKSEIQQSNSISEFVPGFPLNWLHEINSVVILNDQGTDSIVSKSIQLNEKQMAFLNSLDINSSFRLSVNFTSKGMVDSTISKHHFYSEYKIVPETQANPKIGMEAFLIEFNNYLLSYSLPSNSTNMSFSVQISEHGEISQIKFNQKDSPLESPVRDFLNKFKTEWDPALNSVGKPIQHEISMTFGMQGC